MPQEYQTLYTSGVSEEAVNNALSVTLDSFRTIRATDSRLPNPIIDRDLVAVVVALKPMHDGSDEDSILSVGQIGTIPNELYETFTLKAVSRAFSQRSRGNETDVEPMEKLAWLSKSKIYEASSASVNGLHVGFAGGWAHHGRLLATSFASNLAASFELPAREPAKGALLNAQDSADRLNWLNAGQDSGDNTPEHALARERYRFIFDKIVPNL